MYERPKQEASSILASKESSAQASSAARIRRDLPPWLGLTSARGLDEDAAQRQRFAEIGYGLPFLDAGAGVPQGRTRAELRDPALGKLDKWLSDRDTQVAAAPAELDVATQRANAVKEALKVIYPEAPTYDTGSIAHGDALSPLNDVDLGVILADKPGLGPGKGTPEQEMRETGDRLAALLKPRFPKLTVNTSGKRSIVLEFNDPAIPGGADFTCDVILALPGQKKGTLLIPNTDLKAGWDENDPQGHVKLLQDADLKSDKSFSRTVRLVKHWRNRQEHKPFYSWNIKTLALEAGTDSTQPFEGLYRFFAHALNSASEGPTENPGSYSFPPPTVPIDRLEVTRQLIDAVRTLDRARMYALENRPEEAEEALRSLFPPGTA